MSSQREAHTASTMQNLRCKTCSLSRVCVCVCARACLRVCVCVCVCHGVIGLIARLPVPSFVIFVLYFIYHISFVEQDSVISQYCSTRGNAYIITVVSHQKKGRHRNQGLSCSPAQVSAFSSSPVVSNGRRRFVNPLPLMFGDASGLLS